ncbi:hypothetical protein H5410_032037 [Solanum commersonii]|uniref:Uncharacterized protein n=1 Tax=Solanum commersonii TaxID=4109 RepID=A0A9J5YIU9_SOLCO|nr:hypothetical protein H5410_032037 [Solanum commersonii]
MDPSTLFQRSQVRALEMELLEMCVLAATSTKYGKKKTKQNEMGGQELQRSFSKKKKTLPRIEVATTGM